MYDLILDIGCRCPCQCSKPLTDIVNRMGFTPLTLAAKLARKEVNLLNSDNILVLLVSSASFLTMYCTCIQLATMYIVL